MRSAPIFSALVALLLASLAPACGDDGGSAAGAGGFPSGGSGGTGAGGSGGAQGGSGGLAGGGSGGTDGGGSGGSTMGGSGGMDGGGSGGSAMGGAGGGGDEGEVPSNSAELLPYLEARGYLGFAAESAVHPSAGPHGGGVRVFLNPALDAFLAGDASKAPVGAATVKEIYSSGNLVGWAVMVKTSTASGDGRDWYWYEKINSSIYADGNGVGLCTGCHSSGRDFTRTSYPLQ